MLERDMPDAVLTLLRLRRISYDQACQALSGALSDQALAEHALMAAEQSIANETAEASRPGPEDSAVEAFAAWLPGARRVVKTAQDALDHAVAGAAQARAAVALSRTALEAAERLRDDHLAQQRKAQARREQHVLDDRSRNLRV